MPREPRRDRVEALSDGVFLHVLSWLTSSIIFCKFHLMQVPHVLGLVRGANDAIGGSTRFLIEPDPSSFPTALWGKYSNNPTAARLLAFYPLSTVAVPPS